MKKILLILFVVITFSACKGDEGPMGPEGAPGYGTSWYTKTVTIKRNQWQLSGQQGDLNSFYYAEIPLPQLTSFVFRDGAIVAYITPEPGIKNPLPYVLHKGDVINGKEYLWTQTYDYDFEVGYMTFYLTYSDFETSLSPDDETFNIVLMW